MFSISDLQSILSALPDPAFVLTRSGRYAALFGGSDKRYYHDGQSLLGQSVFDVLQPAKAQFFADEIAKALQTRSLHIVEYSLAGSDVRGLEAGGPDYPIWFEGRVQALNFLVEGEPAVLWVASNITDKHAIQSSLQHQSETDALTGLFNRRKLIDTLTDHFDAFARRSVPTATLMFDIDHFKQINDSLGHPAGDDALTTVAAICRRDLRKQDLLARFGGDEFVILMPGTSSPQGAAIADRLRRNIARELGGKLKRPSTISGGLSEFRVRDTHCQDVLKRADAGLYRAKTMGRDRIALL